MQLKTFYRDWSIEGEGVKPLLRVFDYNTSTTAIFEKWEIQR